MRISSSWLRTSLAIAGLSLCFVSSRPAAAQNLGYSSAQIATIMNLRERGESLAEVAKVVGGTRAEVKAAEAAEKRQRQVMRGARVAIPAPLPSHGYSSEQVATVMAMRERGNSLAEVAKAVGGTRADIKAVERDEKARRRSLPDVGMVWAGTVARR